MGQLPNADLKELVKFVFQEHAALQTLLPLFRHTRAAHCSSRFFHLLNTFHVLQEKQLKGPRPATKAPMVAMLERYSADDWETMLNEPKFPERQVRPNAEALAIVADVPYAAPAIPAPATVTASTGSTASGSGSGPTSYADKFGECDAIVGCEELDGYEPIAKPLWLGPALAFKSKTAPMLEEYTIIYRFEEKDDGWAPTSALLCSLCCHTHYVLSHPSS